jgi:PIN domain nuclease of toxin-antitoxin system
VARRVLQRTGLSGTTNRDTEAVASGREPGGVSIAASPSASFVKLLLDTCTFLWALKGEPALPAHVTDLFRDPENEVFLSVASAWEIAQKHARGRLRLPEAPERYIAVQREARFIASLAIDEESALHVARLPALHRDPFDRLLVSQAIVHGMTILTPDQLISQYPARVIW